MTAHQRSRQVPRRAMVLWLCTGALALPMTVSALWPAVLTVPPLRAALIILFDAGYGGMGAIIVLTALSGDRGDETRWG